MLPDEQALGEASAVETTTAAPEAAVLSQDTEAGGSERDYEAEARDMGWYPEAEFKGKKRPAEFLDAKTFVERGEHVLPMLKREREKLEKEFGDRFSKLEKMSDKTIERLRTEHAKEIEALQVAKDAAIEKGDVAGVRKIDGEIAKAEANAPEPAPAAEDVGEVTAKWVKQNPWYDTDKRMRATAIGISQTILEDNPTITMSENLKQTMEQMAEIYPLKFPKTGANGHAPVDGGGSLTGAEPAKDPLAKLSAVEKAQAKKDMAAFPKMYPTADSWLKAYNS